MAATPISCVAGYHALCEIERTNACEAAGRMGDRLTKGLQALIAKYKLPFVAFNQAPSAIWTAWAPCTSPSTGKALDHSPGSQGDGIRQKEMEHMGAAYMAEAS